MTGSAWDWDDSVILSQLEEGEPNRQRLAAYQFDRGTDGTIDQASAVSENMARLRALREAKEAAVIRTDIAKANRAYKAKPRGRFRQVNGRMNSSWPEFRYCRLFSTQSSLPVSDKSPGVPELSRRRFV
jgi:hypothetical protein